MRIGKEALSLVLVVAALAVATPTRAFELLINPSYGSSENTGSTATLTFEFSEQGMDDLVTILIANTTPPQIGSRLTAIGLELPDWLIQPPSLVAGPGNAYFDTLTFNQSVSPGRLNAPGGYDLMITSDGNFLGGNSNGAPTEGAGESVLLSLSDTGLTPEQLDMRFHDFYSEFAGPSVIGRFQAVGFNGQGSDMVGGGGSSVPEPASIILLALGGLTLLRRARYSTSP